MDQDQDGAEDREPVEGDPEQARAAYVAQHGGYWGESVSGPGMWVPVPGPRREERGRGGV